MTMGMLPVSGNTPLGAKIGALPNGRKAGTLTDGIGATGVQMLMDQLHS